jgi:hypothetical protein
MLRVVNMIPPSLSDEAEQDSEPNIAVNPQDPRQIVGTAFTPDPLGGAHAPIYVSADGGLTWALRSIVPGGSVTHDISIAFGTKGGALYAGILNASTDHLNVLRASSAFSPAAMTVLVDRPNEDQPWTTAATTAQGRDRVYMGHNDFNTRPKTASVEISQSARTAAPPAGFATHVVEQRANASQDGPAIRTAVNPTDGTVYAAFERWKRVVAQTSTGLDLMTDVVVLRDDHWGAGANPFTALTDPGDGAPGRRVVKNRFIRFTGSVGPLGQERIGADLAIAVDPTNSANVCAAWCDRVGGPTGTDWTLHVRRSNDRGQNWSATDIRTIRNAKNPALAVNAHGLLGFMCQRLVGQGSASRWVTQLELTADAWATAAQRFVLHSALSSSPPRDFFPYLGDYIRLLAVGDDFYGVFSGSNLPDHANFPNGVTYQRNANWTTHALLGSDGVTPVAVSIDPFFVHYTPGA